MSDKDLRTPAAKRVKHFQEVVPGLTKKQALDEARRCPQCSEAACRKACPLNIDIPGFIRHLRESDFVNTLEVIFEENPMTGFCGRLCSAPCEAACVLPNEGAKAIAIKALERAAFDWGRSKTKKVTEGAEGPGRTGKKVAVIGSGPSGLMAATLLAEGGVSVTVFEALHFPGGSLSWAVPEFRLSRDVLSETVAMLRSCGVEIRSNCFIGQTFSVQDLFDQGFSAVLLATGCGTPQRSGLKGEEAVGVVFAEEILMRVNLMRAHLFPEWETPVFLGEKIVVIGTTEKALDCARIAVRFGKKASILIPGVLEECAALSADKDIAKSEGVVLADLTKPKEIVIDEAGRVKGVKCVKMDFAVDAKREERWKVAEVENSGFILEADMVILAKGDEPNTLGAQTMDDLELNKDGTIQTRKDSAQTTLSNVFACGSVARGPVPFIMVLADAKSAAHTIDQSLKS